MAAAYAPSALNPDVINAMGALSTEDTSMIISPQGHPVRRAAREIKELVKAEFQEKIDVVSFIDGLSEKADWKANPEALAELQNAKEFVELFEVMYNKFPIVTVKMFLLKKFLSSSQHF